MRAAARRDNNENSIIEALEAVGAVVQRVNDEEVLDLIVGHNGKWGKQIYLMEVKDGSKPPSKQKPTPGQVRTLKKFEGYRAGIVNSVDSALKMIGVNK